MTFELVNYRTIPRSKLAKAGGSLVFRNKVDRIRIAIAFIEGVVEDKVAGRAEC